MLETNDNVFQPSAVVLADSVVNGRRLTSFEVRFHRYVLAEFNTHRAFSRNGASSRAIPVQRLIEIAKVSGVEPLEWGLNRPGMSATEEADPELKRKAWETWQLAKQDAIHAAEVLTELGIHKQVVNRVLEPFLPMTMIVTSLDTGLANFFDQRLHPAAAPEMQALAKATTQAFEASVPRRLEFGEWHMPYHVGIGNCPSNKDLLAVVGRCARVSYLNHNGEKNYQDDVRLASKLLLASPPHWSPFEHVAEASNLDYIDNGNFNHSPFRQLRHNLPKLTELIEFCRRNQSQ